MSLYRSYHPEENDLFGYIDPAKALAEDDLCRYVDEVVEKLDLSDFDVYYSKTGSKAYDPRVLLKVFLLGCMEGVYSSRKLMRHCQRDMGFIFLCRGQAPDFRTLARFRKTHSEEIRRVFVQIIEIAKEMELLRLGRIILDSTTIKANTSKDRMVKCSKIDKEIEQLEEYIERLEQEDKDEDTRLGESSGDGSLPPDLADAEQRAKRLQKALKRQKRLKEAREAMENKDVQQKVISEMDPDCVLTKDGATGRTVPGFRCQALAEGNGFILQTDVTAFCKDNTAMQGVLENIPSTLLDDLESSELYADNAYYSIENMKLVVESKMTPIIPDSYNAAAMNGKEIARPREGFRFDENTNSFICPMEQRLSLKGEGSHRRESGKLRHYFIYENREACRNCSLKTECCGETPKCKTLQVSGNPAVVEKQQAVFKTEEGRKKYRFRKRIEKIFGHIKGNQGFRQFLCRRMKAVSTEWSLICSAYNLMRMHSIEHQDS